MQTKNTGRLHIHSDPLTQTAIHTCEEKSQQSSIHVNTMSTSLGEALFFVTLALGVAIKQEFIYVSYF